MKMRPLPLHDRGPARELAAVTGRDWRALARVAAACAVLAPAFVALALGRAADGAEPNPAAGVDTARVTREVGAMLAEIPAALGRDGPRAWLRYFDDDPSFLMASDGALQLDGIAAARAFLEKYAAGIRAIELHWSNIRIVALAPGIATVAADYREELTGRDGREMHPHGYFTGLAIRTVSGWRLRSAHWSRSVPVP